MLTSVQLLGKNKKDSNQRLALQDLLMGALWEVVGNMTKSVQMMLMMLARGKRSVQLTLMMLACFAATRKEARS